MSEQPLGIPAWIKALAGLAGLVLIVNGAFVWISLSGRRDLVRKDYYQAGLEQDARLARRALAASHRVGLDLAAGRWRVSAARAPQVSGTLPPETSAWPDLEGSLCRVSLRRPEDGREDKSVELPWVGGTGESGAWEGPGPGLRRGRWEVLIEWERDGRVFMESAFERFEGM
jgi:hypothetical protein